MSVSLFLSTRQGKRGLAGDVWNINNKELRLIFQPAESSRISFTPSPPSTVYNYVKVNNAMGIVHIAQEKP